MPSRKVAMRNSMSNQTSHFGIMGGLYNRKISGRSSTNRATSRLTIPPGAAAGLSYMKMHNLLSKNPQTGGVGKVVKSKPCNCNLGIIKENESKENLEDTTLGSQNDEYLGDTLGSTAPPPGPTCDPSYVGDTSGNSFGKSNQGWFCCISGTDMCSNIPTCCSGNDCSNQYMVCIRDCSNLQCSVMVAPAGVWAPMAPMSVARSALGVGVVDGILYAVGGGNEDDDHLASVEAYNPATNAWATMAPMSVARGGLGVGVVDGNLYAVGGLVTDTVDGVLASVEAYNSATTAWKSVAPMSVARSNLGVGVLDGLLYAVGGWDEKATLLASVEAYNPATTTWKSVAPMTVARAAAGVGVLGGLLFAVGGQAAAFDHPLASVEAYNPATNAWTTMAPMNVKRMGLGVGVLGGLLYAVGGLDENGVVLSSVEVYNPTTDAWKLVAPMKVKRYGPGVGVLGGNLYAVGGLDDGGPVLSSVEAFTP